LQLKKSIHLIDVKFDLSNILSIKTTNIENKPA
jgi:hypothetical protein